MGVNYIEFPICDWSGIKHGSLSLFGLPSFRRAKSQFQAPGEAKAGYSSHQGYLITILILSMIHFKIIYNNNKLSGMFNRKSKWQNSDLIPRLLEIFEILKISRKTRFKRFAWADSKHFIFLNSRVNFDSKYTHMSWNPKSRAVESLMF